MSSVDFDKCCFCDTKGEMWHNFYVCPQCKCVLFPNEGDREKVIDAYHKKADRMKKIFEDNCDYLHLLKQKKIDDVDNIDLSEFEKSLTVACTDYHNANAYNELFSKCVLDKKLRQELYKFFEAANRVERLIKEGDE